MSVSVRSADVSDLDGIRAFGRRVLLQFYKSIGLPEYGEMNLAHYWESDEQVTAITEGRVIIGERDGRIVGVAEVGRYGGEPIIWKLYVDPAERRRGLGLKLVDAATTAVAKGATSVLVEHPIENEAAARFYEVLGFRVSQVDAGDGPGATTVWRRKML